MNSIGGLLVAVIIKYADNILRCFAQALAIIFGSLGSYFLFNFELTPSFLTGVLLVILAVFFYGDKSQTPYELAEKVFNFISFASRRSSMFAPIPTISTCRK